MSVIKLMAMIGAICVPMCNIPLIIRIIKRRSSQDISLLWATGVWANLVLMAPAGFFSTDLVWRTFNIVNFVLFSAVFGTVLYFRREKWRLRMIQSSASQSSHGNTNELSHT